MSVINVLKALVEGKDSFIDITPKNATVDAFVFMPKIGDTDHRFNPEFRHQQTPMMSLIMPFIQASGSPAGQTVVETKDGIYLGALSAGTAPFGNGSQLMGLTHYQRYQLAQQRTCLAYPITVTRRELAPEERQAFIVNHYKHIDFSDMSLKDMADDSKVTDRILSADPINAGRMQLDLSAPSYNNSLTLDLSNIVITLDNLVFVLQYVTLYFESLQFTDKPSCGRGCLVVKLPGEVRTSKSSRYGETPITAIVAQYESDPTSVSVGVNTQDIFNGIRMLLQQPAHAPAMGMGSVIPSQTMYNGGNMAYAPGMSPNTAGHNYFS